MQQQESFLHWLKHAIDPISAANGNIFWMLPIIFKEAIPAKSMKLAFKRWLTPILFEDLLNSSIKSIKKIRVIKKNKEKRKNLNKSLVKYLYSIIGW